MSDTPVVQITEAKITLGTRSAWLRRTANVEDGVTNCQWALAADDGAVIAMFPDEMYDEAERAAGGYLAALGQADDMRTKADALIAKAQDDVMTLTVPVVAKPVEELPSPVEAAPVELEVPQT